MIDDTYFVEHDCLRLMDDTPTASSKYRYVEGDVKISCQVSISFLIKERSYYSSVWLLWLRKSCVGESGTLEPGGSNPKVREAIVVKEHV